MAEKARRNIYSQYYKRRKRFTCKIYVFVTGIYEGEVISTEEMSDPQWFEKSDIPFEDLMLADRFWLPYVLADKNIIVKAWYGPEQKTLIGKVKIKEVESFPLE